MYNRYIPQADGTYRCSRISEPQAQPKHPEPAQQPPAPCEPEVRQAPPQRQRQERPRAVPAESFLKQLLPKDLDTGDLIVVLLLLLMAGDSQEDRNTALLTLALYLFL